MMVAASVTLTILAVTLLSLLDATSCARIRVGEKTDIADVSTNKEIQQLGSFAVEEYNRGLNLWGNTDGEEVQRLKFAEVVEAQQQVVSGMKYYLKISAIDDNGVQRMFASVVVVKPWLHSKQLLHFGPSSSSSSTSHSTQ